MEQKAIRALFSEEIPRSSREFRTGNVMHQHLGSGKWDICCTLKAALGSSSWPFLEGNFACCLVFPSNTFFFFFFLYQSLGCLSFRSGSYRGSISCYSLCHMITNLILTATQQDRLSTIIIPLFIDGETEARRC